MTAIENNFIGPCVEKWKSQLLDLSARNRALFYRPTRTTLTIHYDPASVWNDIVGEGVLDLNDSNLVPVNDSEGNEEQIANVLNDALRRSKSISDIARTFIDEQGVHVTHAVFGWLKWIDESRPPRPQDESVVLRDGRTVRVVRSPLVFVPVNLLRESGRWKVTLENNAAIESNITLEHAIDSLHKFTIETNDEEITPESVMGRWRTAIQGREHWDVYTEDSVIIDTFSFKKIALLREIERSIDRIADQRVLRALCGDSEALSHIPSVPSYESLDHALSTEDLNLVVPADSSQIRALLAVNSGIDMVIQGPPGTGKSQTITNIISTMLAQGKTVLFVAEKRQARNIVVDNLASAGLGDLVLHITEEVLGRRSTSSSKKDIADQLGEILNQGPGYFELQPEFESTLENTRIQLNSYDKQLHSPIGKSANSTPFQLLGQWASARDDYPPNIVEDISPPSIKEVDELWKQRATESAVRVDALGEAVLALAVSPWLESTLTTFDSSQFAEIQEALSQLLLCPNQIVKMTSVHGRVAQCFDEEFDFEAVDSFIDMLALVGEHQRMRQNFMGVSRPSYWKTRKTFRGYASTGGVSPEHAETTSEELAKYIHTVRIAVTVVAEAFPRVATMTGLRELSAFAQRLSSSIDSAEAAVRTRQACLSNSEEPLGSLLINLVKAREPGQNIRSLMDFLLTKHWAKEAAESDPLLASGDTILSHQISVLKEAEQEALQIAQVKASNATVPFRPSPMDHATPGGDLQVLRSQVNAKRRRPLRWLFARAGVKILQLKPCIVASPLAVAQFLHSDAFQFDLVIFDEASQIPTADAVIPISRAKQVVVVGDSEQMPPTSFFDRTTGTQDDDPDEVIYESVLGQSQTLLPSRRLLWHYRSEDERLIAFSNRNFYNGELLTFPSSWKLHPELGIKFSYLPEAVYGRGGSRANPEEAQRVIELLERELTSNPENTVGVTAMSVAQSVEIQNRIEDAAESSTFIQEWVDDGGRARNLETIQGDEFDVSILSFGYGKDSSGNVQLNFGPLSRDDGYKRLNVAVTRAKKKTIVVSSVSASEIPVGRVGAGGQLVRAYLDYAERGPIALGDDLNVSGVDIFESPLEEEIAKQIRLLGWEIDTQVGVSRYRVDIGIRHPGLPGRYLAGVECDGATYHSAETARDRDIGRQEALERRGWNIFRIWSPDWFRDRERVKRELHSYLSGLLGEEDLAAEGPDRPQPPIPRVNTAKPPVFRQLQHGIEPGTVPNSIPEIPTGGVGNRLDIDSFAAWLVNDLKIRGPLALSEARSIGQDAGRFRFHDTSLLIDRLASQGVVKVSGETLWYGEADERAVPIKISRSSETRSFNYYSDEELLRAMELACNTSVPVKVAEVARATARLLGYSITAPSIRQRIEGLLFKAVQEGYLITAGEGFQSKPEVEFNARGSALKFIADRSAFNTGVPHTIAKGLVSEGGLYSSRNLPPLNPDLRLIYDAQNSKRPLRISYRDASETISHRTVDILGVSNEFMVGYCHLRQSQRTFRIDRILNIEWADELEYDMQVEQVMGGENLRSSSYLDSGNLDSSMGTLLSETVVAEKITMEQARERLIELREREIVEKFPDNDRRRGLLRKAILTRLLHYRPTTPEEFASVIPHSLRSNTDSRQIEECLGTVLETLKSIR